ncbi:MAG TPA: DUF460 domain-containing protein, partial [Methanobacterium sp.]
IATDVYPPPKMVKKLASTLNSKIHSPERNMSVGSKIELVESYLGEKSSTERSKVIKSLKVPQNAHERDALAAAIRTYKSYQKKLEQIETRSQKLEIPPELVNSIKIMVIEGTAISSAIQKVLDELNVPGGNANSSENANPSKSLEPIKSKSDNGNNVSNVHEEKPSKNYDSPEKLIEKLKQKVKGQDNQIKNLKNRNNFLEQDLQESHDQISALQDKIDKLHEQYYKDILYRKKMVSKIAFIKSLQEKYGQEKKLRMELEENLRSVHKLQDIELSKNAVPVKIIESFTRDGIMETCEYWKIKKGDVVLLKNSRGGGSQTASLIINMGVKAVLIMDNMSHQAEEEFERNTVPLIRADDMDLKMIEQFAIVNAGDLSKEIGKWKAGIEDKQIKENKKELLKVIDEYRAKRRRSADNSQ